MLVAGVYYYHNFRVARESTAYATSALQTILARGIRVTIRGTVKVCRDPNDDMFLECAALAKADLLVAGDKDLLALSTYKGTRIVTPSAYLKAR